MYQVIQREQYIMTCSYIVVSQLANSAVFVSNRGQKVL